MTSFNVIWSESLAKKVQILHKDVRLSCLEIFDKLGSKSFFATLMSTSSEKSATLYRKYFSYILDKINKGEDPDFSQFGLFNLPEIAQKISCFDLVMNIKNSNISLYDRILSSSIPISLEDLELISSIATSPSSLASIKFHVITMGKKATRQFSGIVPITNPIKVACKVLYGISDISEIRKLHRTISEQLVLPLVDVNSALYLKGLDIMQYAKQVK